MAKKKVSEIEKAAVSSRVLVVEKEQALALENGAFDYVSRPFDDSSLIERLRSAIRQNLIISDKKKCPQKMEIEV